MSESETPDRSHSRLNKIHNRIQSKLDELHTDFRQLETDSHEANEEASRARKGRIDGFKRAQRDLLEAADRADREWH
jgi:outer membrane murein-binding lipoprotein Lpp